MVTCRQNKTKMYTALYGVKYLFPTYLKYGIRYDSCNTYIYLQLECILIFIIYLINSCHTFTFQLLDKSWSLVSPLLPRFLPSIFIAHRVQQSHCSSILHRLLVANSRSRAFRKSISAQEKVPTNIYECALGGARTHEADLY